METKKINTLLCAIGKLENKYIKEWVEYHKNIGFTNIVLCDNNDIGGERFEEVINDHIQSGFVILKDYRGVSTAQVQSYKDCFSEFKDKYDWIAFWDIDEFISLEHDCVISDFLSRRIFDNASCIRLCWKQYTDNNLINVVDDNYSVVNRFTEVFTEDYCIKHNINKKEFTNVSRQTKSIVRTNIDNFDTITSPHVFLQVPTVNALGKPCNNSTIHIDGDYVWKNAWINHYRFKTIEEYINNKSKRGWPTDYKKQGKNGLNLNFFFKFNALTESKKKYVLENFDYNQHIYVSSFIKKDAFSGEILHNNFGDELNFNLLPLLFDKEVEPMDVQFIENYAFIGSILTDDFINDETIVWGTGVQNVSKPLTKKPKKVCAVRGPLTRRYLLINDIPCPRIYGDPALLLPEVYNPKNDKKYKIGIIPHWQTKSLQSYNIVNDSDVLVINFHNYKSWTDVIDQILSCEYIVSESLHGLIISEAYGIPNLWVNIDLGQKYNVKFHDFFLSLKMDRISSYKFTPQTNKQTLLKLLSFYQKGKMVDLNLLKDSCPIKIKTKYTN